MNTKWIPGVPTDSGVYWFDTGNRFPGEYKRGYFILQIRKDYAHVFGTGGSLPLNMIYNPKVSKNAAYSEIKKPSQWIEGSTLSYDDAYAWVRSPEKYLAVGLVKKDSNCIRCDAIWLDNPRYASQCGWHIDNDSGHLFCPIDEPALRKI